MSMSIAFEMDLLCHQFNKFEGDYHETNVTSQAELEALQKQIDIVRDRLNRLSGALDSQIAHVRVLNRS